MLSAIVLAAGLSSRMGTANKLLLPFNDKPAVAIVVEAILASGIKNVIVVTGHEAALVEQALKHSQVRFTFNINYAKGMTSSIQQGVSIAGGNGYMICLSDMVMITSAEYTFLKDSFERKLLSDSNCICLPHYKNAKGNPVIFSASYKEAILTNKETEGCKNIVQSNKEHLYMVEMSTPHVLQDFDYPADYQKMVPVM